MKNKEPFDFQRKYRDPKIFLLDPEWRTLMSRQEVSGVVIFRLKNASDDEVKEIVLEDILGVTMYEIQSGHKIKFEFEDLYRYLTRRDFSRAMKAYRAICEHFVTVIGRSPRVKTEKLFEAMDYCGTFYTGYLPNEQKETE